MNEREIFAAALECPTDADRRVFLDGLGDPALCGRIEALLAQRLQLGSYLEHPPVEVLAAGLDATILLGDGSTCDAANDVRIGPESMNPNPAEKDDVIPLGFLQPSTRADSLGRLSHYEILEVLGQGAFGIVLKAFDDKLQRVVAIKVLLPHLAATSPARKRFTREARASAKVRHENVVSIYNVEDEPIPYLVMEYIPGETLQKRLDDHGPLDLLDVLRLGKQIADGLAAAHAQALIHRDVKPGNILLDTSLEDHVKITDFGLARAADDASMTQSGMIAGTPLYMAPEQALGHKLDQRADLFSFGSVLYQMVSGRPPFRASSTLAVLKRLTEDTPRPIREIIPETPAWLCDIITKLHAKNPDERYQSAREIADVLANCEAQLKEHSRLKDLSLIPRAKTQPAGWWKWVAAAAVVVPLLAIALYAVSRPGSEPNVAKNGKREPSSPEPTPVSAAKQEMPPLAIAPFDAAQAKAHQEAWAKHLGVPVEITSGIGMKLRLIPPGRFLMRPDYDVTISKPLRVGTCEVTIAQFRAFVDATGFKTSAEILGNGQRVSGVVSRLNPGTNQAAEFTWRHEEVNRGDDYPVAQLSWDDAAKFCEWLSSKEGQRYRLPTEAEWEWACRAGSLDKYHFGSDPSKLNDYVWHADNSEHQTHPVGLKKPNSWGLFDVHGNVCEYCREWHTEGFPNASVSDPAGPASGQFKVTRGGGYLDTPQSVAFGHRGALDPHGSLNHFGFRIVCEIDEPEAGKEGAFQRPAAAAPPTIAPFTDADAQRIAALPTNEQVAAVFAELKRRNPGFDDQSWKPAIEGGVVAGLSFRTSHVADIRPLRALTHLRRLSMLGGGGKGGLTDLSPLQGMKLTSLVLMYQPVSDLAPLRGMPLEVLRLWCWAGDDLTPLKGMPLQWLNVGGSNRDLDLAPIAGTVSLKYLCLNSTNVSDLTPLENVPLTSLECANTRVSDLTPLHAMRLELLTVEGSLVTDLDPLERMPLKRLHCDLQQASRNAEVLRGIKTLEKINEKPAAEFWEDVEQDLAADPAWLKKVAALPAAQQIEEVRKELIRRNPGFDGELRSIVGGVPIIKNGIVTEIRFCIDQVSDISPLRALRGLRTVWLQGSTSDSGKLSDLSPLKGMQLTSVSVGNTPLTDLSPLARMQITQLGVEDTNVESIDVVKEMPIKALWIMNTQVADLSPLAGKSLDVLRCTKTNVKTLRGLPAAKVKALLCDPDQLPDKAELARLGVTHINGKPVEQFVNAPFTDADVKRIAALPAAQQIEEVRKELIRRNPGFDGVFRVNEWTEPKIQDGVVVELALCTDHVRDISPLRALKGLRTLGLMGSTNGDGQLTDLSPLKGMELSGVYLYLNRNLTDLSPLRGMRITHLGLWGANVADIEVVKEMPLKALWIHKTPIADLSPLAGKSLEVLYCAQSKVKTLQGLLAAEVQKLYCDLAQLPDKAELARLGVTHINGKPVAEFFKEGGMIEPQATEAPPPTEAAPP